MHLQSRDAAMGIVTGVAQRRGQTARPSRPTSVPASSRAETTQRLPGPVLVVLSATSLEFGGALAKTLFASLGLTGTLTLRAGLAAVALLLLSRPSVRRYARASSWQLLLFGLVLAGMNLCFYLAISRVPFAVAVTIELVGPLTVAALGSRGFRHALWVLLAAAGVLGFAPIGIGMRSVDPLGLGLSLMSAACCAAYILLSARVGRTCANSEGLALAMTVAAIVVLPLGIATDGARLLQPWLLLRGAGVALLSSVVPYSLEIKALRRMPTRVFGVLVSLQPAIAALAGWIVLRERLEVCELVAIALVTLASMGAARS